MIIKNYFILSSLIFSCIACNSNREEKGNQVQPESSSTANTSPGSSVNCYEWTGNNDTIRVRLEMNGEEVTGTIVYDYFQKDRNEGALKGKLSRDIIIADYSFNSEGTRSVRQVAFKKAGNDIIEGFGPMEEKEGKMSFVKADSLSFNPSFVIPSVNCD